MIRVLVCDDHEIVRHGIQQMLADADGIEVVAEAVDGPDALRRVRELATAGALDVVLMDIALPHRDGLDILRQLRAEFPKLPVLMLSTYPDRQYAVRSLKLGAAGYLNKSADSRQMAQAIVKAAAGGRFITPNVAELLAGALAPGRASETESAHERLSSREDQVFRLLASGSSVGEIAQHLSLSPNTVSTYRARVLEKTGARNDVELALYAVRADLLQLPPAS